VATDVPESRSRGGRVRNEMPTPVEQRKRARRPGGSRPAGPRPTEAPAVEIPFGKTNYIIFGVAAAVILTGYFALSRGSITLAPFLLLVGYLVLIPWGILARPRKGE